MRVLAIRIASGHLTALWPIAMAELQRILLSPHAARPALLLAACQLIDTVLTVLPDDFSPFGWMFVPSGWTPPDQPLAPFSSEPPSGRSSAADFRTTSAYFQPPPTFTAEPPDSPSRALGAPVCASASSAGGDAFASTSSLPDFTSGRSTNGGVPDASTLSVGSVGALPVPKIRTHPSMGPHASEFAALLEPIIRLGTEHPTIDEVEPMTSRRAGLLKPSPDGRRRPLLGLRTLNHASDLTPFATHLRSHLAANALLPRAHEVDTPLVELLVGCEFLSGREAEVTLAPYWLDDDDETYRAISSPDASADVSDTASGALPTFGTPPAAVGSARLAPWQRCTPQDTL